ncbi:bifunctional UDP-N-acetylglucosamine diphosphorylase/glucosamine-1-phosphate N-acetyltransferase GlmU [Maridesulfovibrio hydrothermalis]|uniref:Bifunctional protein GlmU n=1 Tax=Maridesulfovibrio hydrothermalis AM13 = DSM 14728 TaxID=1121451 RepID=L0RCP4_9BACT|nr:bifunctional UDP-N-acetylglucosamine diphosphorylase/glucosamine-1-phosphate N-acetyltransferase GlmU [Maridesulfovibrio hydrothermalis]CCO23346.1 fused N-acetyl glucosamine-1-phosphate uridyltransferase; glucosamine-1-phosphate acetyl transferase [Maridesulfovibrio hydrothermalis AM13 = DSM 14728]
MLNSFACALVLAGGKGTRMHSDRPKVLKNLLGESMLYYVYSALRPSLGEAIFTIVGFGAQYVEDAFPAMKDKFVLQKEQLGTGHALQQGWDRIKSSGMEYCLVINGDTPLISEKAVSDFLEAVKEDGADLSFVTITPDDPCQFGRVLRNKAGQVTAVVEAKDYDTSLHGPVSGEVNAGIYCLKISAVDGLIDKLTNENKSGEYYITDLVDLAVDCGMNVTAVNCGNSSDLMGINNPYELAQAESALRIRIAEKLLRSGVTLHNWESVAVGPAVEIEPGAEITGPCEIYGKSRISRGAIVQSHVRILNSNVSENAEIKAYSHLEDAEVGPDCSVGPYGRLRPGAVLMEGAKVGNFVEIKKAVLGKGAKASHLTYLGDSEIGPGVNIGAGTITCNYDGKNKFKTVIGEGAFIGSNTALVAPVTVGKGALVAAGSTITKDVKDGDLAVARSRQVNIARTLKKS